MQKVLVPEIVTRAKQNYLHGSTKLGDYVSFSMHETIEKITAYINSKHIFGEKDSLNRDKPFFNIITAATNIWYRATDIDRKDIIVRPNKLATTFLAFMATVLLHDWMKRERFGVFLNLWGRTLSQFGSAVVKFVEKDGKLKASVVPWNRLIVDPVDFYALPTIEKIYMTPAQIRKVTEYDPEVVEKLIDGLVKRKTQSGTEIDAQSEFIELYEVHGELPSALLLEEPEDKDWMTYTQQVHVISFLQDQSDTYKDFCLYKGKEAKHPYMITHLIEEDGRTLSIGAVETLFDAQWMQNHTMKNMKDTLDLASKLLFQTSDPNYVGRNVLNAIETGDILIHALNQPLTQLNNSKSDIVSLQSFSTQWKVLAQELTATPDAFRGITPPSGTPYSTVALLTQQANSLFEIMVENKGLAIEDMLRTFVIPHLKTKLNTDKEIMAILEDHDIKKVDAMYIPNQAIRNHNKRFIEDALNGRNPMPFNQAEEESVISKALTMQGNSRSFAPIISKGGVQVRVNWKEALKDLEWELDVGVTNEQVDKIVMATTLTNMLQTLAQPGIQQNPVAMLAIRKIMNLVGGISPVELSQIPSTPQLPTPAVPELAPTR